MSEETKDLWPERLITAQGLTEAMLYNVKNDLLNGKEVDVVKILKTMIKMFEDFDL